MYVDPVLWSEQNQITSQVVDIFTKNQTCLLYTSRDKTGRFVGSADREEATGREKVSSSDDNINGL